MKKWYAKLAHEEYISEYYVMAKTKEEALKKVYEICGEHIQVHEK